MYCSPSLNISTASLFCCLSLESENHWLFDWVLAGWEEEREERERERKRERGTEEVKGEEWRKQGQRKERGEGGVRRWEKE